MKKNIKGLFSYIFKYDNIGFIEYLSLFLLLGILYQYLTLLRYGYTGFFSWGQVINDTIIIFIPIIVFIYSGYRMYITNIDGFWKKSKLFGISIILMIIIISSLIIFLIDYLTSINLPMIFQLPLFYIMGILIVLLFKIILGKKTLIDFFIEDDLSNIIIVIFILMIIFLYFGKTNYLNTYFKDSYGNEYKIIYINDKYIFTDKKVFSKIDKYIFYKKDK